MLEDSDIEDGRSPKRRRVNGNDGRYSSPDELAASSDHEISYHQRTNSIPHRDPGDQLRRQSYGDSASEDSPDELDHTIHTFYRDGWNRSQRQSRDAPSIESPMVTPRVATPPRKPPLFVRYKQIQVLRGHRRGVAAVRFSPDGRSIASCSADATIRIWDTATGKQLQTLEGHLAGISTIAWSPDSKTLASGSDDKAIRLWDVSAGKSYPKPLLGHSNYIYSLAFSPKGNMLVSGSYDEAVFLWDVRTARIMRSLPAHSDPVGGVDFIHDGTLIVSCAGDGLIRIWDTSTGQCLRTLVHEDNAPVTSVRFSPNGKFVLAWTLDSCVRLWNYVEGRCVKTYQGHGNTKYSLTGAFGTYGVSGDDRDARDARAFVVGGSEDGMVVWWDVQSKEVLQREGSHEGVVLGVDTWGPESLVVSGGTDRTVRVWARDEDDDGGALKDGMEKLEG